MRIAAVLALGLAQGEHIRITAEIPGVWIVPREQVGVFLWITTEPGGRDVLAFSLRPLAGTQDLPVECITAIERTDAAVSLPRKVRRTSC